MSSKDPNFKRMGLTIAIVIYIIAINTCQAVLLNLETNEVTYSEDTQKDYEGFGGDVNVTGIDALGTIINFATFFFGGFLLTIASFPEYMIVILTPIYIISLLVFWLLVFDYIKDISILGSSI